MKLSIIAEQEKDSEDNPSSDAGKEDDFHLPEISNKKDNCKKSSLLLV